LNHFLLNASGLLNGASFSPSCCPLPYPSLYPTFNPGILAIATLPK
jgi:hypothetical protein